MMKRIGPAALALALAASIAPAAMAEELVDIVPISAPAPYTGVITINGEKLDTAGLPGAEPSLIPMRLVADADYGFADWYPEEDKGYFALDDNRIYINFSDNSVEMNGEVVEGVTAVVTDGVTFLPVSLIAGLEGYEVAINDADGVEEITISTPNGAPLMKLAREIMDTTEMASSVKNGAETLKDFVGIDPANYDEFVSFSSMMIRADALFIGKVAQGADMDAAKEELEGLRERIQQSFEQYLPDPLEMAKAGKVVEKDGYVALFISPDVEKAVALFEAGIAALDAE